METKQKIYKGYELQAKGSKNILEESGMEWKSFNTCVITRKGIFVLETVTANDGGRLQSLSHAINQAKEVVDFLTENNNERKDI